MGTDNIHFFRPTKPSSLGTLADLKALDHDLLACCSACNRTELVNIDALIDCLGAAFGVVENRARLLRRLKCSDCGAAADGIILQPPSPSWAN